ADSFTLEGNLNVGANGMAFHTQGGMSVNSLISGSSFINILGDGAGRNVTFMNAANTFNGNIEVFNGGNLIIADSSVLNFDIGASGSNNAVSGAGSATYDGSFVLNLSGASSNVGDSWVLNSAAVTTYGATFSVQGFTDNGNDTWSLGDYLFSEATSTLTVVPEPSALGLAATGLFGLLARRRSHRA
ncbi:MAG: PEP-CTERM sorting domain-containing protein, partial [Verrucomicrobiales bacterium]